MSLDAVYVTYWSLKDPLCQSQSLPVVRALAHRGRRMAVMTFEQPPWTMTPPEARQAELDLAAQGIRWEPLRYHKRPPVVATLFDIVTGVARCLRLAGRERPVLFHGRGTVAAAIAWAAARLTRGRFMNDADGPLSEEYVDAGVWGKGSLPHRLTRWAEKRMLTDGDAVAVLTEHRRDQVQGLVRTPVTVLPCGVETALFAPRPAEREAVRRELGLTGVAFVYVGKAGGWYLTDAMFDFVEVAGGTLGGVSLLILTTQDPATFLDPASRRGLRCVVRAASRADVPRFLAAGDAGLSFVLPAPSKAACSPVKNGEYLACGMPVVTTDGIGDYSDLVRRRRVGVVVEDLAPEDYRSAAASLRALLSEPGLADRCRDAAREEVGMEEVVIPRYLELYRDLLDGRRGRKE